MEACRESERERDVQAIPRVAILIGHSVIASHYVLAITTTQIDKINL